MQSVLIIHSDNKKAHAFVKRHLEDLHIIPQDILTIALEEKAASIGIAQIKDVQKKVYYKPSAGERKAIVIQNAETLSEEAQNALLKVLEEPPKDTLFYVISTSREAVLPTIQSRCQIIELPPENPVITPEDKEALDEQLTAITKNPIPEGLLLAESLSRNKKDALIWLRRAIIIFRGKILADLDAQNIAADTSLLKAMQETLTLLEQTNVTPRLALENLFFMLALH